VGCFADVSVGCRGSLTAGVGLLVALLVSGCQTSSTVSTSPSPVKCVVSLGAPPMMDAVGATGSLSIFTQPECAWDASTNVSWISALTPASGQGSADVSFRVAANEGSSTRDGMIVVNGEQARVSQRAPCRYEVTPSSQSVGSDGGPGRLTITTASECPWTATVEVGWIALTSSPTGTGTGTVSFTVARNEGAVRSGTIAVANQRPTVTQSGVSIPAPPSPPPACDATISPTSQNISAAGGAGIPVTVSAASACQWTATSAAEWITVTSGATGTGSGSVTFSVAGNTGAARTGTLTIAGRTFTVTQAASTNPPSPPSPPPPSPPPPSPPPVSCSYSISPTSANATVLGGTGTVNVSTTSGCAWSAGSNASWILIPPGASGTGNGSVQYVVLPNTSGARTGTLTIAGQTFTLAQAALVCSYAIAPMNQRLGRGGGTATINVSTSSTCTWTASSSTSWISVISGASGTGNGTVTFSYTRNDSRDDRTGSLTVAGRTATVEQNGGGGNNDD
jgi:Putative binding domain, N-terminal/Viral BACON domain